MINFLLITILLFITVSCNQADSPFEPMSGEIGVIEFSLQPSFEDTIVLKSKELEITISNSSRFDFKSIKVGLIDTPFTFKGDEYPGTGGDCSTLIKAENSCKIVVLFSPEETGTYQSSLSFSYLNGLERVTTDLNFSGRSVEAAKIEILSGDDFSELGGYNFGDLEVNGSYQTTFRVKNIGGLAAAAINIGTLDAPITITNSTCGSTLAPESSCDLTISYDPLVTAITSKSLSVVYNNGLVETTTIKVIQAVAKNMVAILIESSSESNRSFGDRVVDFAGGYFREITLRNNGLNSTLNFSAAIVGTDEFTITDDCLGGLTTNESCTVTVNFTPTTPKLNNLQTATLRVTYSDNDPFNPQNQTLDIVLTGTGVTPAELVIDGSSESLDFGEISINESSANRRFVIKNIGGYEASNFNLSNLNSTFTGEGGECFYDNLKLSSGDSCTVLMKFNPTTGGVQTLTPLLGYDDGSTISKSLAISLSGTGVARANLVLYRLISGSFLKEIGDTINYKLTYFGNSTTYEYRLTNEGTGPATLATNVLTSGAEFQIISSSCSASLADGDSCSFFIKLTPTAAPPTETTYTDSLTVEYDNGGGGGSANITDSYNLSGATSPEADIKIFYKTVEQLTPYNITVTGANPTSSAISTIELKGVYEDVATITSTIFSSNQELKVSSENCSTLAKNATCQINIRFTPLAGTDGITYTDQLTIIYRNGDGVSKSKTLNISAESKNRATLQLIDVTGGDVSLNSLVSYEFTSSGIGNTSYTEFKVKNIGNKTGTNLSFPTISAPFSYSVPPTPSCIASIVAGGECSFTIAFNPTTTTGTKDLQFDISFDDTVDTGVIFSQELSGMALTPANLKVRVDGVYVTEHDFGPVPNGLSKDLNFLILNLGQASADVTLTGAALESPFSVITENCNGTTVMGLGEPNSNCQINIKFRPDNEDDVPYETQTVTIHYGSTDLTLDLTGRGIEPSATFNGWSKIISYSENSSSNMVTTELEWNEPTLTDYSYTIAKYYVYRATSPLSSSNINTGSLTPYKTVTERVLLEEELDSGTSYYYSIRPVVVDGGDQLQKITADDVQIKVITPPPNMALIHKKMANQEICTLMGASFSDLDKTDNYSCIGFSLEASVYVDLYELSSTSNNKNETPISSNQFDALSACTAYSEDIDGETVGKRLLNRQEQFLASRDIDKNDCNINSIGPDDTGENSDCYSYYKIYDLVGNLSEWTLDWILSAQLVTNTNLDESASYNTPLLGTAINHPHSYIENAACISYPLGLPFTRYGDECTYDSINSDDLVTPLPSGDMYYSVLSNGTILGPRGILGGGNYNSGAEAGRWSIDLRYNPGVSSDKFGIRCGFSL